MTHLYIEQNGITEEVNSQVIEKLYNLASSGDLDGTSDLKGRLHLTIGYRAPIDYLNTTYPDLYISADDYAIPFEDPNMVTYLNSIGIGSNGMITEAQAAAATIVANSVNTTVTKFNELKYFTSITGSRGGLSGTQSGYARFAGWTALEEVDISNYTSIGHSNSSGYEDTFNGCTSLKKVIASNKLTDIGANVFYNCNQLEEIIGLPSNVTLHSGGCFNRCSKLKQSNFDNVTFTINDSTNGGGMFERCPLLTSLSLSGNYTEIKPSMFSQCSALTSVSGLSNVTKIRNSAFAQCNSLTTIDIDWSKITTVSDDAFNDCSSLVVTDLSIPNLTDLGAYSFKSVKINKVSDLGTISALKQQTFKNCTDLTQITLPQTCVKLDNQCFYGCTNLTSISLSGIQYIGESVFEYSGLTGSITLPSSLKRVRYNAFNNTNITSITYPASLTQTYDGQSEINRSTGLKRIGIPSPTTLQTVTFEQGFDIPDIYITNNKQVSITVPDTVRFITGYVDRMDSTSQLTFSNNSNVEFIGRDGNAGLYKDFDFTIDHTLAEYQALCNTGFSSIFRLAFNNFPKNNMKYLPRSFQEGVNINDIRDIIGSNIVVIGKSCLLKYDMTSLNYSVTLPASLKFVGEFAFKKNAPISWIFEGTTPPIFENTYGLFSDGGNSASSYNVPIYVPASAVSAYQAAIPEYAHCIQANPT